MTTSTTSMTIEMEDILPKLKEKLANQLDEEVFYAAIRDNVYSLLPYVWEHREGFAELDALAYRFGGYTADDPRRIAGGIAEAVYSIMRSGSTAWKNGLTLEAEDGKLYLKGTGTGLMELVAQKLLSSPYFDSRPLVEWYPLKRKEDEGEPKYIPRIKTELFVQGAEYLPAAIREYGKKVFDTYRSETGSFRLNYLPVNWSEVQLSDCLVRIMRCSDHDIRYGEDWEKEQLMKRGLDEEQAEAIQLFREHNICIWTGAPGTGKTKTIETLCDLLIRDNPDIRIAVAAPTGIAAQNLQRRFEQAGGHVKVYFESNPARTLHSLLVMRPARTLNSGRTPYSHKKGRPLPADVVIVDEFGMVDLFLARTLFWALRDDAKVVLAGDPHQLPSVNPGNVLYDLTYGLQKRTDVTLKPAWIELKRVHRTRIQLPDGTEKQSSITLLVNTILESDKEKRLRLFMDQLQECIQAGDVEWIQTENNQETFKRTVELYEEGYRLVTPMHEGVCGRIPLNQAILKKMKKSKHYEPGVPVIQNVTDYSIGVVNGEYGRIVKVKEQFVTADFNGREITLPLDEAYEKWLIGYATTVHKSQGLESPVVMIPLWTNKGKSVWRRKLFYTALSRAKQKVILVGSEEQLKKAITRGEEPRRTMLRFTYEKRVKKWESQHR